MKDNVKFCRVIFNKADPVIFFCVFFYLSECSATEQRLYILSAMQRFHEKTCIQFRPRTIERDYIVITEGEG